MALAGVSGYVLARRALVPIDHLGAEARRISADRLHERLSVPNQTDEIGRLAVVINDTLARLESSFDQLRRFTADASHELRTPLSVIRGIGEMGLRETRTPAEYKDAIGSMLEEVDRLTRLVDTLLRLSRGDAGTVRLAPESRGSRTTRTRCRCPRSAFSPRSVNSASTLTSAENVRGVCRSPGAARRDHAT